MITKSLGWGAGLKSSKSMDNRIKRLLDVLLAGLALVFLWPVMVLTALIVRHSIGRPALFRQQRPGLHEKPFHILKFRTMTDERDASGQLLPDKNRLTLLGKVLRRTSLDELPELINVLLGEMSLVGPRPLLMSYLPYYSERERIRHQVRPGITGWAQIHGRNFIPWDERLALDVWYVENQSLLLDLKILVQTIFKVIVREGVSADPDDAETDLDRERQEKGKNNRLGPMEVEAPGMLCRRGE